MSIKNELGLCTRRLSLWVLSSNSGVGFNRSAGIVFDDIRQTERWVAKEKYVSKGFNKL